MQENRTLATQADRSKVVWQGVPITAVSRMSAGALTPLWCLAVGVVDALPHRAIFSPELVDVACEAAGDRSALANQCA